MNSAASCNNSLGKKWKQTSSFYVQTFFKPLKTFYDFKDIFWQIGQQCCVRLHGPKSLTGFKLYATSANKCQHCCGSMQTDATSHNIVGPNNVGCCWPTMLGPFALYCYSVICDCSICFLKNTVSNINHATYIFLLYL